MLSSGSLVACPGTSRFPGGISWAKSEAPRLTSADTPHGAEPSGQRIWGEALFSSTSAMLCLVAVLGDTINFSLHGPRGRNLLPARQRRPTRAVLTRVDAAQGRNSGGLIWPAAQPRC